jgi:hypothetical protein
MTSFVFMCFEALVREDRHIRQMALIGEVKAFSSNAN